MITPEFSSQPSIESYDLPEDVSWQRIEDVPSDFRDIVELHKSAESEGEYIEQVRRSHASLDDVYDTYDNWEGLQRILIARDGGVVVGVLSYYYNSKQQPFFESVAVDPEFRSMGIGGQLIDAALSRVAYESDAEYCILQAQERVASIYARRWGAKVLEDSNGKTSRLITMAIPVSR